MRRSTRILLILSLFIAISDGTFVFINYRSAKEALDLSLTQQGAEHRQAFELSLDSVEQTMAIMATYVANDPRIQDLFRRGVTAVRAEGGGAGGAEAARIRAELLRVVQPSWQEVTRDFKVRQLHFHMGPGSTSYLRVHKPKLFGDDMNQCRYTVVTANQALKTVTGFETGRVVSGIRGVVPVFAIGPDGGEASHVGALEAGTSFGTILPRLSRRLHAGLAVLLTDRHVQANVWPNQMHRAFADTTTYEDFFVEAYTGPAHHSVFEAGLLRDLFAEPGTRLVELDGFAHAVTGFHLRDWRAENNAALPPVGLVLIWTDATDQVAAFQRAVWINVFYALLGFCVVEILLFIAVKLITRHLEIVIADRTAQLNSAQDLLVENAHKVGMAEVATDVLHNVGNVLNSVSVGASTLRDRVRNSRLEGLQKAADLLRDQAAGSDAVQDDERDHKLPTYLTSLAEHLQQEQTESLAAITNLQDHIEHLSRIVSSQQDHCRGGGLLEPVDLKPFVDRALEINGALLETAEVRVVKKLADLPPVDLDRHRTLPILVNLIRNAAEALMVTGGEMVLITAVEDDQLHITVKDDGIGICPENLTRIFEHGFTTKADGHGFGLHGAANTAFELGGSLRVQSQGLGQGAEFILTLPYRPQGACHVV